MPATIDRLSDPPMGALPTMPEVMQPIAWPVSSRDGTQPPGGGFSASTDMMAKKSTAANAVAETTAGAQPPRRSTAAAMGMSHGHCRTQLVRSARPPALSDEPAFGAAGAGIPTTSPGYSKAAERRMPTAVAVKTSAPGTRN